MMKYNTWKLLTESLAGTQTLGLARPQTLGGIQGAQLQEDEDLDGDEDDVDDDAEDGDDDNSLDGDLLGASEDEGPEKSFPPDDSEEADGLPTPGEELAGGDEEAPMGGGEGDDMNFLNDIDPALLGDEGGMPAPPDGGAMAPEGDASVPCPECNPDGGNDHGDPNCPACNGDGFTSELGDEVPPVGDVSVDNNPVSDPGAEMLDLMSRMRDYAAKYMPKYMDRGHDSKPKYMDKKGAAPKQHCEADLTSQLVKNMSGTKKPRNQRFEDRLAEDMLLKSTDPDYVPEEPAPGSVGFAPQGRVGGIGGGYTQDDVRSIPVLGESVKFPTLAEYIALKARQAKK